MKSISGTRHWLVTRFSSMGDVTLTTGVLRWLHEHHGQTFTVLTKSPWAPIFDGHPAVRAVLPLPDSHTGGMAFFRYARELARGVYPEVPAGTGLLDLHDSLRSRLLRIVWKGPVRRMRRHGTARRLFLRSGGRMFGKTLLRHNVPQRYALAMETTAPPRSELLPVIYLTDEEKARARARLDQAGISAEKPLVALHPYAAHTFKTWPQAAWQELIALLEKNGYAWCVIGAGQGFLGGSTDFTGQTDLRESCALLHTAKVLVTGDSGPMHLAGAVATPVVALFGPTAPQWGFYPEGPHDTVLEVPLHCRPCSLHGHAPCTNNHECMTAITPHMVATAVSRITIRSKHEVYTL